MATTPTQLPVPSEKPQDLKFNAGKIDEFTTSMGWTYTDRFGVKHYTIEGLKHLAEQAISAFGYITLDSFEDGANLTLPNQILRWKYNGEYYRWDGNFPKAVVAGSTPDSSGGIGNGKWLSVGAAALASPQDGSGDALVAVKFPIPDSVPRTQHDKNSESISVLDFCGDVPINNGIIDATTYINNACSAINNLILAGGRKLTLFFPDGTYKTSSTLTCYDGMSVKCSQRVTFQNFGSDKTFSCWNIMGGGRKITFGTFFNYGAAFANYRNTNDIYFHSISQCVDGFILRADGISNLDNEIHGVQIANCTNGVVFEQNADSLIQQGNNIKVNFISETQNAVVFRNFGGFTHTKQSNWDSNCIEIQAVDPLSILDSSLVRNYTGFGVPNLKMTVKTWLGGWVPDAGTICLIRGRFSAATYEVSLAGRIGLNELVDSVGKSSFGSCVFKNTRYANLGSTTSFYQSVSPGSPFNGGVSLVDSKFRIRCSVPDLSPDQVWGTSFNHVLSQVNGVGRARLIQAAMSAASKYTISVTDAGTENLGMVRIWFGNYTSSVVTGRDMDLIVEVQ